MFSVRGVRDFLSDNRHSDFLERYFRWWYFVSYISCHIVMKKKTKKTTKFPGSTPESREMFFSPLLLLSLGSVHCFSTAIRRLRPWINGIPSVFTHTMRMQSTHNNGNTSTREIYSIIWYCLDVWRMERERKRIGPSPALRGDLKCSLKAADDGSLFSFTSITNAAAGGFF